MLTASNWLKDSAAAVCWANVDNNSGIISADSHEKRNLIFPPDSNPYCLSF
jgi:hypothetical protein